ncbi:carbon storage regulator, CsrA [Pseudomonas linyingensis]|uniref:Carbon storage regulator, CsrA n=1 Tax=Pseudomonas linyingensis TaxID=915471 RepID=A0A1H7A637_9PSED|nr:carbon storage regulator [Pseudomonas linyingensis]SEJ57350.1 carbon storage regulator, CsrA [Pseudomonas linyingensis]
MAQGSLVLSRRVGQKLILTIDPSVDPQVALQRILEEGIEICVTKSDFLRKQFRLGIKAPREVRVQREELVWRDNARNNLESCSNGGLDIDSDGGPCELPRR